MGRGRRVAIVTGCIVVAASGCGSSSSARRHAVNEYFQRVDAIQAELKPALTRAQFAFNQFGHGQTLQTAGLTRAARAILRLRQQLVAVTPPSDALPIHRDLLALLAYEAELAHEVRDLSSYLPAQRRPLQRLRNAESALRMGLQTSRKARAQERVFALFADALGGVLRGLEAVHAPHALAAWHHAEVLRVRRLRADALDLRAALRAHDARIMTRRLADLRKDLVGRVPVSAERAAILAYDRDVGNVNALIGKIESERAALERRLG
jgi:hypothetical protein